MNGNREPLAVAVPVHDEECRLPRLIDSLRAQTAVEVPVVFVDNGSTDASAALVRACPEVASGRWFCLEEERVGKANAMATATAYCAAELGATHVCFLDADCYCLDDRWVERSLTAAAEMGSTLGYIYSPVSYVGLDRAPVFAGAYRAVEAVFHGVVTEGMSFAYAGAATYPVDLLQRFFREAKPAAEQGLRLSLLALWEGLSPFLNPGVVACSGRRFVVNSANLRRWSFYDREFYRRKDINGTAKLDLDAPTEAPDLDVSEVGLFFARQALKIAVRNLVCVALFDLTGTMAARVGSAFAVDLRPLADSLGSSVSGECVLGDGLDELLCEIALLPATIALARCLEDRMREAHRSLLANSPGMARP